jgi:hypothetical protein
MEDENEEDNIRGPVGEVDPPERSRSGGNRRSRAHDRDPAPKRRKRDPAVPGWDGRVVARLGHRMTFSAVAAAEAACALLDAGHRLRRGTAGAGHRSLRGNRPTLRCLCGESSDPADYGGVGVGEQRLGGHWWNEAWQRELEDWIDNRYQPARQRAIDEEGSDLYWPDMQRVQSEVEAERWQGSHSWDEESTDGGSAYSWWQGRTDWWQS